MCCCHVDGSATVAKQPDAKTQVILLFGESIAGSQIKWTSSLRLVVGRPRRRTTEVAMMIAGATTATTTAGGTIGTATAAMMTAAEATTAMMIAGATTTAGVIAETDLPSVTAAGARRAASASARGGRGAADLLMHRRLEE